MNQPHESAHLHVTGEALYVDDLPVSEQLLVGRVIYSRVAHAKIRSHDLSAARSIAGVHAVLCADDIPGHNQMGPVVRDEPCLAKDEVMCAGQAMFLVAAETAALCLEAERLIKIDLEPLPAILTIEEAMKQGNLLGPPAKIERGDVDTALQPSPHVISGEVHTGAQEHFYLETQVCLCVPGEGREISVFSSTQHPSETQALVAEVLGIPKHEVVVEVRRLGGGFGGKETQANHVACWTALLCRATGRPVKIRLFRDDDMQITGKRHRFVSKYEVGFDDEGHILAAKLELNSDGGCATDLSFAIMQRAMLHVDSAYYVPNLSVVGRVWRTNLPSNTAMRGFGAPQAMALIENIVDRVARFLRKDPAETRYGNFYGIDTKNVTHYGQAVENNRLYLIYDRLMKSSRYAERREAVSQFNSENEFYKKGIALTPVKFGISFTTSFLNQASALVLVYKDGTILVNHGGIEMGQGLHTKIQQIAAAEFGVSLERVKVSATNTSRIPNTSATAASSGSDLNGMAVKNAIDTLKSRIAEEMAKVFTAHNPADATSPASIVFTDDFIVDSGHPDRKILFAEAMPLMHLRQVSLSAEGFYRTPTIGWDKDKGYGKPFYYYAFGMAVTEVLLDLLTGQHTILRTDILHDVGDSLNPGVDRGQVEGGFVQGVGWCTTEEIKWDDHGNLLTHSPDTYKIPTVRDIPQDFRVELLEGLPNVGTIRRSKAVGEPPFMLALSCWLAIKDAVSAIGNHELEPEFSLPATNEVIVLSIETLKKKLRERKKEKVTF